MGSFSKFAPPILGALALALTALCQPAAAVALLNGGAEKAVYAAVAEDGDTATGTSVYALVPGASRTINVPAGGDTIVATFTAECVLLGSTSSDENWVQLIITDNAVPILPTTAVGTSLAFCAAANYSSHSVQVAKRLDPGSHAIRVFWKIVAGNADTLTAYLDDYALTIAVSE